MFSPDYSIKCFSVQHLILSLAVVLCMLLCFFLIKKTVKTERGLHRLLVILCAALLVLLALTRYSHISHAIAEGKEVECFDEMRKYSWQMLFPDSFCSLIALFLPFFVFAKKYKNNTFLEAVYSLSILGMLTNLIYPEYFGRMPFWEFRAIGAYIYHILCGFICILLLWSKNLEPKLETWFHTPVALSLIMILGFAELTYFDFAEAFNLTHPLVASLFISSWGFLCIGYVIFDLVFRLVRRAAEKKRDPVAVTRL